MTTLKPTDEFDAARMIVEVLKDLKPDEQARVFRWAQEKLGMVGISPRPAAISFSGDPPIVRVSESGDIRSFIQSKNPTNDVQFAAAVAYYYAFEAPPDGKKTEIGSKDLQEAARLAQRARLTEPAVTLNNAIKRGYLDRGSARGMFRLNTVGENLVAMGLPTSGSSGSTRRTRSTRKK
jgi:hypothetical protein